MSSAVRTQPPSAGATTVLSALLEARTGQQLAANRTWRLEAALGPLLAELALPHADALVARLLDGQDHRIGDRIVDVLLNHETSFFRDAGVIESAVEAVRAAVPLGTRPRIWCAACATGQEPLSLAMLFAEDGGTAPDILATDVSASAIARARSGSYSQFEIQRGLPIRRMMRWFESDGGDWIANKALLSAVSYRRHNLATDPVPGRYDLILCRNVLFYLTPVVRQIVLERLAQALKPGALLLLGAGETVIGQSELLRPSTAHRGFYERVATGAAGL
ncbi:chemotaxis protein methyltransferase CheR [Sphingomonas palmae]|uniref:Chemotaxis protein methyltransferase CheR n=1 Tax=Sphingomonas palmae TaxID=1855283 RepID=A0A1H7IHB1_9SPHN|nr:protein-glutamate O-methyltransferase CheR [Sphingomonas palmae]SEK60075.1 chemotaxis protein methyltransferase CheR [Sphingomonas palmae]